MKNIALIILSLGVLSSNSSAENGCITVSNGIYFVAGRVDPNLLPNKTIITVPQGSINPVFYSSDSRPPPWEPPLFFEPGQGLLLGRGPLSNSVSICFTNVALPTLPLPLPAGFSLVACQSNMLATFEDIVGRPPERGSKVYHWRRDADPAQLDESSYDIYTFDGSAWHPEVPIADIGEAVWVYQPPTFPTSRFPTADSVSTC
jgi:hypothetical protein